MILLQLSRFSVVSPGRLLAKACTLMSEVAVTEGSSDTSPGQPLVRACTLTPVILAQSQGFSAVSPGRPLAKALVTSLQYFKLRSMSPEQLLAKAWTPTSVNLWK